MYGMVFSTSAMSIILSDCDSTSTPLGVIRQSFLNIRITIFEVLGEREFEIIKFSELV